MLPPTVADQQAKLGVSAEESKALRIKRQQARFRDRGGAFVPSTSNPLVDILLARTVSGESPSKVGPKDAIAKRRSPAKARQSSPTRIARLATVTREIRTVPGSSKAKQLAAKKGKAKAVEPEAEPPTKPPMKRRATARAKKKTPDPGSDTEQPRPSTSSGKGAGRGNAKSKPKPKPKPKAKAESNTAKTMGGVVISDDDSTLVEVPHIVKSNAKRGVLIEDEQTDDDAPIVKKRAKPRMDGSNVSSAKATARAKTKKTTGAVISSDKMLEHDEARTQVEKRPKTTAKKRPVLPQEEEDVVEPPVKKWRTASSTVAKPKALADSEPERRSTKDVAKSENPKTTGKGKGKVRAEPVQDIVEPVESDDERPLQRASKSKKRKTEEDSCDDRPRKVVKFVETGPTHSSSKKLKENQLERKRESRAKPSLTDELGAPHEQLATKQTSRAKTLKGPPQEVLERIKASAARHLRCVDSEPDELDCLS